MLYVKLSEPAGNLVLLKSWGDLKQQFPVQNKLVFLVTRV